MQDNELSNNEKSAPQSEILPIEEQDETWRNLADYQVSLPLSGLLKLVPYSREKVALLAQKDGELVSFTYSQLITMIRRSWMNKVLE